MGCEYTCTCAEYVYTHELTYIHTHLSVHMYTHFWGGLDQKDLGPCTYIFKGSSRTTFYQIFHSSVHCTDFQQ